MHLNGQTKSVVTFEKLFFLSMFQIIFSTREFKLELVTLNSMQNIRKENTEFLLATLLCFGGGGWGLAVVSCSFYLHVYFSYLKTDERNNFSTIFAHRSSIRFMSGAITLSQISKISGIS